MPVMQCFRSSLLEQSQEGSRLHVRQLNLCGGCGHPTVEHRIEDSAAHGQHEPGVEKNKHAKKSLCEIVFICQKNPRLVAYPQSHPQGRQIVCGVKAKVFCKSREGQACCKAPKLQGTSFRALSWHTAQEWFPTGQILGIME